MLRLATKKPWAIDVSYFTPVKRPLYLTGIAVSVAHQRHGLGRRALEDACAIAEEWPADAIRLDTYDAKAGAGGFYARCGFLERGRAVYKGDPLVYYERLFRNSGWHVGYCKVTESFSEAHIPTPHHLTRSRGTISEGAADGGAGTHTRAARVVCRARQCRRHALGGLFWTSLNLFLGGVIIVGLGHGMLYRSPVAAGALLFYLVAALLQAGWQQRQPLLVLLAVAVAYFLAQGCRAVWWSYQREGREPEPADDKSGPPGGTVHPTR